MEGQCDADADWRSDVKKPSIDYWNNYRLRQSIAEQLYNFLLKQSDRYFRQHARDITGWNPIYSAHDFLPYQRFNGMASHSKWCCVFGMLLHTHTQG
jgi:hypothetical protein